jgi:ABC-type transporter Mla maintaining outer membrane lipid asymmetry ATPase subunit MlaF
MKDGVKNTVVTRLGLQVRFVDAETGQFFTGSGLGEATTVRELTLMNDDNFGEVRFNQSTIGIATKKALEIATSKIVTRMINRGIYDN